MELFKKDGFEVVIDPKVLMLKAFADIYRRDRKKDKRQAHKELVFIYWYCDYKSEWYHIRDDEERAAAIKEAIALPEDWKIDKKLQIAIDLYLELSETTSSRLLKTGRAGVQKLQEYIDSVDLKERDKGGKPIHDVRKYQQVIDGIPETIEKLQEAEKKVLQEQQIDGGMRGGKEKNTFEGGI